MTNWNEATHHYGTVEFCITVGGKEVEGLFNKDGDETHDPLDAVEYLDEWGIPTPIKPHQHVVVKTGRRTQRNG